MSKELKEQARALGVAIAANEAKLREGRASLNAMMAAAVEEGTFGTKAFNDAFETASRPVDALAETIGEQRTSWASAMALIGESGDQGATGPFQGAGAASATDPSASWGERFVQSKVYQDVKASGRLDQTDAPLGRTDGVKMTSGPKDVKALLTSTSWPLVPDRQSDVVALPQQSITILDLISIGATSTEIVEWVAQSTRTNNAASVAEGVAPAESTFAWTVRQSQVQEVAHFAKTTKRAVRDEAQLQTLVDQEMVTGLRVVLQNLIISGGGTGTDFTGLLNTTGINSQTKGTDTWADAIHKAMTKVRIATLGGDEPTVIGIHPNDFEAHALTKDTVGNYINGGPNGNGPSTIWGLRPVVHVAFPQGTPLVGNYARAKLWIWSDVALAMTDSNEDDFKKRLIAVLASFGGAFGGLQPKAFCEIA